MVESKYSEEKFALYYRSEKDGEMMEAQEFSVTVLVEGTGRKIRLHRFKDIDALVLSESEFRALCSPASLARLFPEVTKS